ncbi:spc97/spc98 family domain-containing protein [Rhizoctonia solani AG-1 IA]|uniref:Spc97/spc98 family domain-containing protein n=1 Tax=Thanatephorus cucumeris (strain AG1-IA) TaxID=983506 RepID=L8WX11_THACA|nr:spc97/spc98 family domain-containing protein [Rhizoctonia solani AG-1 IA]
MTRAMACDFRESHVIPNQMFSIDSNALNQTRFVVHPLKPINLSTPFDSTESQSPGETTRISDSDSDSNQSGDVQLEDDEPDVWTVKASEGIAKNSVRSIVVKLGTRITSRQTFSWDAPVKGLPTRSAFLSEQSAKVFVAARFHVQPRLISDGDAVRRFISPADLLSSLRTTLLGGTSQLFSWDERDAQHTVRVENNEFGQTILVLGELSEETTSRSTAAASRALAYSLQSIISLIQSELTTRLPETLTMASLSRLSTSFNDLRFELTTLKPLNESPPFAELPSTQTSLLDHLFLALDHAISHSAPYRTSAMIAYLLVTSSQDFNDSLAVTIGLVLRSSRPAKSLVSGHKIDLPSFFSERSKLVLGSAARALDILRRADPEHPLCRTDWAWKGPGWGWFDKDLHAVDALTQKHILNVRKTLNGLYGAAYAITSPVESEDNENETHSITSKDGISPSSEPTETTTSVPSPSEPLRVYKPEIATFSVFDQPPGSHIPAPIKDISVAQFISNGPRVLPLSAPTLPLLLDVSLLALPLAHSRLISSALFRVFTGRLAFKAHLKVLRGFLLGDDAKFWSRLRGALFEEAGISHVSAAVGRGIRAGVRVRLGIADTTRDNMADERAEREGRSREWGVGLAVGLSDREGAGTWPPGGAELGLRLRHVIDDTLGVGWGIASTSDSDDEESETARERGPERIVLKETPWRLGFILRDLEEESPEGRARWLNPNVYIRLTLRRALDFLCLDYKPPDPIDAIITLDIRYHSSNSNIVYGAILTAGPVETVTRILFNTIFQEEGLDSPPVLLMARFKIQSFISSLIGYVKDMAIGFHWDSFLAKLDEIEREDESKSESTLPRDLKKERMASDIFARAVGNALKECMEAVLVLGKLVGDRCRQHSSSFQDETYEKQFVLNVAKVLRRFDRLHNIAALRALDLKGVSIAAGAGPLSTDDIQLLRRQEGESEGIYGRMATWLDPAARCTKPKTITA